MPGPTKKRAHKKRREELKKQARAPGTQKGFLCYGDRECEDTNSKNEKQKRKKCEDTKFKNENKN